MMSVSGVNSGAIQPLAAAEKMLGTPKIQRSEEGRPLKPVMDEYIPEEQRELSGRYLDGQRRGRPKIYFDDPEGTVDAPEKPEDVSDAKGPEKKGREEERCVGNTDKVDREIERLKKKKKELEQRLSAETDEAGAKDLERRLAQVERELSEKDNDTYRKQHSTFTQLS